MKESIKIAKDYADCIFKGPLSELGGLLSDSVGFWRLKNRIKLMLKVKQWLEEKGLKPQKILPDIFIPLLEDGGNVENESLSDMFASLLASHLDPMKQNNVHPSFTKVLVQLSSLDAEIMLEFRKYVSYRGARDIGLRGAVLQINSLSETLKCDERLAYLSCLNLERLGIIEHTGYNPPKKHPTPKLFRDSPESQNYRMTEYGIEFCDACNYNRYIKSAS